jgi:hypothetical protein
MNERIRELAEQAGFYFYDMHDIDGQDLGESIEADKWSVAEKFAELIVKECQTVVEWAISVDSTIDRVPMLIQEHFGVEE